MSRSILKNKYIRRKTGHGYSWNSRNEREVKNTHRCDEMPKNKPSKLVLMHCHADVDWLQDATYCGGHSRRRGGHRMVSGLVRASLKRELEKKLKEEE